VVPQLHLVVVFAAVVVVVVKPFATAPVPSLVAVVFVDRQVDVAVAAARAPLVRVRIAAVKARLSGGSVDAPLAHRVTVDFQTHRAVVDGLRAGEGGFLHGACVVDCALSGRNRYSEEK